MTKLNRIQRTWEKCAEECPEIVPYKEKFYFLWQCSRFTQRVCNRYPQEALPLLVNTTEAGGKNIRLQSGSLDDLLSDAADLAGAQVILRRIRMLDFLLICWLDLVEKQPIERILRLQSEVADRVVISAEKWLRLHNLQSLGKATTANSEEAEPLIVLALGKLGGGDLNFSSDIDVFFCCGDELEYHGRRSWTVHEYYLELGRKLVNLLGQSTVDGFAFRVDLRLRPFGESGPLVVSLDQLESYLQAHGREWERYAFIKCRVVTGQFQYQAAVQDIVRPFVYRKYIDFGVIESLRDMKALIEQQVQRKQLKNNIKLGRGGIREIEFVVQVVQLMRGGQDTLLQVPAVLAAMEVIESRDYLCSEDVDTLRVAYYFLRRLENHVQMADEQQVHELPVEPEALRQLARSMGMTESNEELLDELHRIQANVHKVFSGLIQTPEQDKDADFGFGSKIISLEELVENRDEYARQLQCEQALALIEQLGSLLDSNAYRQQDTIGRERLNHFLMHLLPQVAHTEQPEEVMRRLLPLLRNILRRSSYLVLLHENPSALTVLVRLASSSPWIVQHLAAYPVLLDDLLMDLGSAEFLTQQQLYDRMIEEVGQLSALSYEDVLDRIRQFKHSQLLRVARASVENRLTVMQVSDQLAWITECVISGCLDYLRTQFADVVDQFGVIAFGKLGGIEMSYASDLDLVFVYQPAQSAQAVDLSRTIRLAQKLTQMLSLRTVSGKLYEVDVRLRPYGQSGPIVSNIEAMRSYYQQDAWTWEIQALVRARMIFGNDSLHKSFSALRSAVLCQPREQASLASEVSGMREKMFLNSKPSSQDCFDLKKDRGGITDIEFMVQYAVLANACEFPKVVEFTDNFRQMESLSRLHLMSAERIERLTAIYLLYRSRSHELALQAVDTVVSSEQFGAEREFVTNCWNEIFTSAGEEGAPTNS